jgi:hypothetical protein
MLTRRTVHPRGISESLQEFRGLKNGGIMQRCKTHSKISRRTTREVLEIGSESNERNEKCYSKQ